MELQQVLDRSLERTSARTRSFFPDVWDAERIVAFVNKVGGITVATANDRGFPHAAVVIARCVGTQIHFTVTPSTILERNLTRDDRIGFSVTEAEHSIMGQGRAVLVSPADNAGGRDPAIDIGPPGWVGSIWRVEPSGIFAG